MFKNDLLIFGGKAKILFSVFRIIVLNGACIGFAVLPFMYSQNQIAFSNSSFFTISPTTQN